jgi:hypothetical protein
MAGSNKLFVHLEPLIIKNIDDFSARDLSHVVYSYGIRNAGNPEIH